MIKVGFADNNDHKNCNLPIQFGTKIVSINVSSMGTVKETECDATGEKPRGVP